MNKAKNVILYCISLNAILSFVVLFAFAGEQHQHKFAELYSAKSTCTEKGFTVYSCDCGESYKGNYTDALGHIFSNDVVCFRKSTCIQKGEGGRYCKRCYAKTDIVYYSKTSHTPVYVTVKATAKKNGERRKECSICKKLYSKTVIPKISSIKLDKKIYVYVGRVKTPSVTVKDANGKKLKKDKDYSLVYQKGRKKTGVYSVNVTFKGNYEGTKTLFFKIRPTAVKNITASPSISSVYLSWDKSKGADGYEIYLKNKKLKLIKDTENLYCTLGKIDGKKLKSGTDYVFVIKSYKKTEKGKIYSTSVSKKVSTKPQKASIGKVKSVNGNLTVTSVKQNCHGYEFLLSTNKSFSNPKRVSVKAEKSTSYTFKSVTKGKKYYLKVRAYVVSGGEKYYGYYSDVKTVKT
ncbi:MAG: fibronectin type III domain-containing protein [Clostridia bacterium]|nr:fibronectin type III domain-containing protein [Clostridia bacterium]